MMQPIKIVIADDELHARDDLARMIAGESGFEIMGQAADGRQALELIRKLKPDAVFLDIEMPEINGIEVAMLLSESENPPLIVFSTAFDQYAVNAFEANALDYILKPCRAERLLKALEKIKKKHRHVDPAPLKKLEAPFLKTGLIQKIAARAKNSKEKIVIDPSEIDYFYAESAEVFARFQGQDYVVHLTLKELSEGLENRGFAQSHKAYLVNLSRVKKIVPLFSGNFQITLRDTSSSQIPLSRRYAKHIRSQMGGW